MRGEEGRGEKRIRGERRRQVSGLEEKRGEHSSAIDEFSSPTALRHAAPGRLDTHHV